MFPRQPPHTQPGPKANSKNRTYIRFNISTPSRSLPLQTINRKHRRIELSSGKRSPIRLDHGSDVCCSQRQRHSPTHPHRHAPAPISRAVHADDVVGDRVGRRLIGHFGTQGRIDQLSLLALPGPFFFPLEPGDGFSTVSLTSFCAPAANWAAVAITHTNRSVLLDSSLAAHSGE